MYSRPSNGMSRPMTRRTVLRSRSFIGYPSHAIRRLADGALKCLPTILPAPSGSRPRSGDGGTALVPSCEVVHGARSKTARWPAGQGWHTRRQNMAMSLGEGRVRVRSGLIAVMLLPASALAQSSTELARTIGGEPSSTRERLTLADRPRPAGPVTRLFDGRSLSGWDAWLGYANPAVTYKNDPANQPIGTGRDTSGDFAVR